MNIQGTIHLIFESQQVKDTFRKREFILLLAENPKYPQYVSFQLTQDKCELIDNYNVGDEIEVQFNLKGREWVSPQGEKKFFNTIEAWKLAPVSNAQQPEKQVPVKETKQENFESQEMDSDLPF